jgi:uncharacterized repeat protein (TIGR01451 family)
MLKLRLLATFTCSSLLACCHSAANAGCSANSRFNFSFTNIASQTLSYANSYTMTATNALGQSRNVTLSFTTNGLSSNLVNGIAMPEISTFMNDGGTTNSNLIVGGVFAGRTIDVSGATRVVATRFTFGSSVHDFSIQVNDVDYSADQFRDWLQMNAVNGSASYASSITTPHGNNNSAAGPHAAANSTALIGSSAAPLSLTVKQAGGTSTSSNNSNSGTINATVKEPILQAEVRYGNYPFTSGESQTGQQAIGIQGFSFCPMPEIGVTKASVPLVTSSTSPERFNIPGTEIVYSITISNTGGGIVDLNSVDIADILPSQLTFRNADFDEGGPLTTNFEFNPGASGLSLAATDVAYSNNGGGSYAYTPMSGYDANVSGVRFNPKGTMAANSSFSIKFRARIN